MVIPREEGARSTCLAAVWTQEETLSGLTCLSAGIEDRHVMEIALSGPGLVEAKQRELFKI